MDWSRPVVTTPIADFGSPHDIVTKDDIHIRHFEQRCTWAVGGIHRIRNQDDFQFFVLHNSWLTSVHIHSESTKTYGCIVKIIVLENHLDNPIGTPCT